MNVQHDAAVSRIASEVRALFAQRQPFRVFHGSTNSTRPGHGAQTVDISALGNVLSIDQTTRTAVVEPNVPMDQLVQATLARGLVPPVVMEFPGITAGGGFAGSAGESSSFRHGYFDEAVRSVEVVLATGDVVCASADENADLFRGARGSAGTLGIVTKLELALVPARRFVRLVYRSYASVDDTIAAVKAATEDPANDYVDGILFSPDRGLVMVGRMTDDMPTNKNPQTFSRPRDPWFYLRAESRSRKHRKQQLQKQQPPKQNQKRQATEHQATEHQTTQHQTTEHQATEHQATEHQTTNDSDTEITDHIPLAEYLFRYDRGGFWAGAQGFRYFWFVPFCGPARWLLDDFMHARMLFRALQGGGPSMSFRGVVQDVALPYAAAADFVDYAAAELAVWPLWLCPLRAAAQPTFHPSCCPQPMLNIGVWGAASGDLATFVRQNRALEAKLTRLGGRKVLYAHTYYSEDEFWALYDRAWYDGLRAKYQATTLPSIYDKVHVDVAGLMARRGQGGRRSAAWVRQLADVWPVPGLAGIFRAIRSRDYKIHRRPLLAYWEERNANVQPTTPGPGKGTE
ncbi:hypothetical protein B0T26DRAFT_742216 [Lasiosphaeria miniovina]|uniref:Delta(24)-sterol reductase n=1 Tax=Lasiosphaeria miniovina TaxID=1954250 RepID=A0AA40ACY8_9PEZI|nr:uncharacterized protein B0T26DRAFT_742216 [Lasiosphaeria miniovina]KAK0713624.1 hypothetical protein B0T26DRAFT_742216 [Lasiosphaeria miniovina]